MLTHVHYTLYTHWYTNIYNTTNKHHSIYILQVHQGIWRQTGEKVAVKIQHPRAEVLGNIRLLYYTNALLILYCYCIIQYCIPILLIYCTNTTSTYMFYISFILYTGTVLILYLYSI